MTSRLSSLRLAAALALAAGFASLAHADDSAALAAAAKEPGASVTSSGLVYKSLKDGTGAPIAGCAPLALETVGQRADASFDGEYVPDRVLADGEALKVDDKAITAVATPGHTSNHLCFAYGDALLTGDHVMGWSTTVVVPPDGDMAAYMRSLDKLRQREDRIHYPAHGPAVTNPQQYVRHLMGHRMQREKQILKLVGEKPRAIPDIVANAYPGLDPRLVVAAGGSVLAHLLDLQRRGLVEQREELWTAA